MSTQHQPAIDQYSDYLRAAGHPDGTVEQYAGWPARLLRDTATTTQTVTGEQIVVWLAGHRWAANTRRKGVANLRLYFAWAQRVGLRADNPAGGLKPVRGAVTVPRPLPEDVYRRALAGAGGDQLMRLRLAGETGLRRAELAAVHSDDVTLGVLGYWLHVRGKGRRERHVPLGEDLARWVRAQHGYVFPSPAGGHCIPSAVGRRYTRLLGGTWTTHTLRHRFATRAYAATGDIEAVRQLLGHDSVRTTQVYIQTAAPRLRVVAAAAAELHGGINGREQDNDNRGMVPGRRRPAVALPRRGGLGGRPGGQPGPSGAHTHGVAHRRFRGVAGGRHGGVGRR